MGWTHGCPISKCSPLFPPCPVPNALLGDPEWLFSGFCFLAAVFLFSLPLSPLLSGYSVGSAPVFTLLGSAVLPPLLTPCLLVPER